MDFDFATQKGIGVSQLIPHASTECVDLITKVWRHNDSENERDRERERGIGGEREREREREGEIKRRRGGEEEENVA